MDGTEVFYNLIKRQFGGDIGGQAHSYLLCSNDSVSLMLLARLIVENDCGDKFFSPDVKVYPDNAQNKTFDGIIGTLNDKLSVADIEQITTTAVVTPLELKYKYYILKNGETLNDASSNKLLKTLEEPPKTVKIIILAENEYVVLSTIRSRCRIITPHPLSAQAIDGAAAQVFADSPLLDKAKKLSGGNITRLIKAASGGFEDIEKAVFDTLLGMKSSPRQAEFAQKILKQKSDIADIVDMLELVFADVLLYHYGLNLRLNYRSADIKSIAQFYNVDTLIRLKPVIDRTRARLKLFGNANSVVDELLFSLLEVRQKCQA